MARYRFTLTTWLFAIAFAGGWLWLVAAPRHALPVIENTAEAAGIFEAANATAAAPATSTAQDPELPPAADRPAAPEFPASFKWLNSTSPLKFGDQLKGQVVVLDFWTYCCINCMHNLANLEKIEAHFKGQPLAVVGVHSNKFTNEAEAGNIKQAVLRYKIQHPVVVDEKMAIWDRYDVQSWPTIVFIDATGHVVGKLGGELAPEQGIAIIEKLMAEGRAKGVLAKAPLPPTMMKPEPMPVSASGLMYPGKIIAAAGTQSGAQAAGATQLFVADSGNGRVVALGADGGVRYVIGDGASGNMDGPFDKARFKNPQGMAFDAAKNVLYIADTDNHTIRKADLTARTVTTILGTGAQVYDRIGGKAGKAQGLNSPWDLLLLSGTKDTGQLIIAMAGEHQLWKMGLAAGTAAPVAGTGAEGLLDKSADEAELAQPSGLTQSGGTIYFADSEGSAVRSIDTGLTAVKTLIGEGLFTFGDVDGGYAKARFQHPLGVAAEGTTIYVADTYNHKIRAVDTRTQLVRSIAGAGKAGAALGSGAAAMFNEPGGLAVAGGRLYVADTNNHRIVAVNPADGTASEIKLAWPAAVKVSSAAGGADPAAPAPAAPGN